MHLYQLAMIFLFCFMRGLLSKSEVGLYKALNAFTEYCIQKELFINYDNLK